jgi:hypothetical protein
MPEWEKASLLVERRTQMNILSQEYEEPMREKRKQDALDADFSLFLALAIGAEPNTCFNNILDLFQYFPDVFSSQGKFIEGWYVVDLEDEVVINEHGWIELPRGKLIDPTVVLLLPPEQAVYYFPGVERSWQEVHELVQKRDVWFPYVRGSGMYGEDGLGHPAYNAAYEAATRKVFALANASQPPKRMTFLTAQDLESNQGIGGISVQIITVEQDQEERSGE